MPEQEQSISSIRKKFCELRIYRMQYYPLRRWKNNADKLTAMLSCIPSGSTPNTFNIITATAKTIVNEVAAIELNETFKFNDPGKGIGGFVKDDLSADKRKENQSRKDVLQKYKSSIERLQRKFGNTFRSFFEKQYNLPASAQEIQNLSGYKAYKGSQAVFKEVLSFGTKSIARMIKIADGKSDKYFPIQ